MVVVDVFVLLDSDAAWRLAQLALRFLGDELSHWAPFGRMAPERPMELGTKILLAIQLAVPVSAGDLLLPCICFAVEAMMEEILGSALSARIEMRIRGESSAS